MANKPSLFVVIGGTTMNKTITIGDKECTFSSSAMSLIVYQRTFGRDMLGIMSKMNEDTSDVMFFIECAYAMSEEGRSGKMKFDEWLDQFNITDLTNAVADIVSLVAYTTKTQNAPKENSKNQ